MLPLLIRLAHSETGVTREAGFRRSPVRIGRNHLNDLTIDDGFVSQWHGIVRFDDESTRFLDVGSTNGTMLAGERIEAKEEVIVEPEATLTIGPLTISMARVPLREDQVLSRRSSSFSLGGTQQATLGTTAAGTVMLRDSTAGADPSAPPKMGAPPRVGAPAPASASSPPPPMASAAADGDGDAPTMMSLPDVGAAPPPAAVGAPGPSPGDLAAQARQMQTVVGRLKPIYERFAAVHAELGAAMSTSLQEIGTGPGSAVVIEELERMMPLAFENPATARSAGRESITGGVDAESWIGRLVPAGRAANWGTPNQAMERAGAVLEAFAASYVDLRKGQRQVMNELGVEPGTEGSTLHVIEDPRELIYYLLDERAMGTERLNEISRAFADIALHQVGMVNGATDGARALLWQISPHTIGAAKQGSLVRTSASLGDYLWPFGAAGNYYKYATAHLGLSSGNRMNAVVFGQAFAKAYYRVTGGR